MALTKVSGNILDPGINVAGVVTATGFDGPFSGGTDGNFSGNVSIGGTLRVAGVSTFNSNIDFVSTDAGSAAGPELKLFRNSASPADADYLGQIKFAGESDTGVERNYAKITGKILDASNTTEDGILEFSHIKAGSQTITGRWRSDSLQLLNSTNLSVAGNADITGDVDIDNTTESTSKTTGALKVDGGVGIAKNLYVGGNLVVEGTRTEVQSASLEITDKTIGISSTGSPSDTTADGAGIVVYGATDKKLTWENSSDSWLTSEHIKVPDNKRIFCGTGTDLSIYHDTSDSKIVTSTGDMWLQSTADDVIVRAADNISLQVQGGEYGIDIAGNAAVQLFYDASVHTTAKLATTATGVSVHGEVAASQDYPDIRPTLDFNFAAVKKLDSRITYTRTGPASYTDEFGKVVLVGDNTPRFDHDPSTRECKGFLLEESRTNYVRQSLTLATDWFAGSGSYGYNATITNPDGSVGAYYHTGGELYHQNIDLSGASTNVAIVSMWVKERSGHTGVMDIEMFQQISGSVIGMGAFTVNPITGTITTNGARWSDGTVTEYPNGWYRFSAKATTASGNFSSSTRLDIQNNEHYVWGMQVEVGDFPTSFIPTRGSTATRGNDLCQITGQEFSDFYNQSEGTIVTEHNIATGVANGDNTYVYQIDDGSDTNVGWRLLDHNSAHGDLLRAYGFVGGAWGSPQYGFDSATPAHNTFLKVALGMKNNDFGVNFFGGTTATDTSGSVTGNGDMTELTIGNHRGGTAPLQGYLRRFIYYPQKLTTNQLKTITS